MSRRSLMKRFSLVVFIYGLLVLTLWFGYHRMAFSSIREAQRENITLSTQRLLDGIGEEFSGMRTVAAVIAGSASVQDFLIETDVSAYYEKAGAVTELIGKVSYPIAVVDSVITMTTGGNFYRFTGSISNASCQSIYDSLSVGGELQSVVELEGAFYYCHASPVMTIKSGASQPIGSVVLLNELQKTRRILTDGQLPGVDTAVVLDGVVLMANNRDLEGQRLDNLSTSYGAVTTIPVAGTALTVAALTTRSALQAGQTLFMVVSVVMLALSALMLALLYRYLKRSMLAPLIETKDEMQLGLLSTQMDAHLVFNSISCIQSLSLRGENEKAAQVSAGLAAILKHQHMSGNLVNSFVELEMLERYIEIMNIRHEDRYEAQFDVADTLADYLMPAGILQPIVENALTHGLGYQEGACVLQITGALEGGIIVFSVADNGVGMDGTALELLRQKIASAHQSEFPEQGLQGVALVNIQKRIRARFGADFGLGVDSAKGTGTTVTVTLPALRDK